MPSPDLFISHSSGDADVARSLRTELEAAGYSCWMAPDDVTGTVPWAEQILAAIETSRAMLVLISSHSNRSPHVSREVSLAMGRDRAVLPIRIEAVTPEGSIEYHLAGLQRLDAFPPPITEHRDKILRRLAAIVPLQAPAPAPAPEASRTPEPATESMTQPTPTPMPQGPAPGAPAPEASTPPPPPLPADQPTEPPPSPEAPKPQADLPTEPTPPPMPTPGPGRTESGPVAVGTRIAGFTIQSILGEGGMATVYRATQDEPRRSVALKLIRSDHAADPNYRERFLAEKDTLAALEHPSIIPIYAAGDADGHLFIAMRLIDAPDLGVRLTGGPLSLTDTVATLRPIADAIDYAHEMGVIHRDLKPSNVLLDRRGTPYLTDFGLGKNLAQSRALTAAGAVFGTLDYMAPEQFTGAIDPALAGRIDVYALGCLAFACLLGSPPFAASEPQQAMFAHLNAPPPSIATLRPDLPAALDGVFRRVLAKNPAERFATAAEFIANLAAVQVAAAGSQTREIPVPPRPATPAGVGAWAKANPVIAGGIAAVAAIALVGGALVLGGGGGPKPSPTPTRGAVVPTLPVTPTSPTATVVPTQTSVVVPTPPPGTIPPGGTPAEQLLAQIPEEFRDSCVDPTYVPNATPPIAQYVCFPEDHDYSIYYYRYEDEAGLRDGYEYELDLYGTTENTGDCSKGENSEDSWSFDSDPDGTERGRLLCDLDDSVDAGSNAWLMYTYTDALIMVEIAGDKEEGDPEEKNALQIIYEYWATGVTSPLT